MISYHLICMLHEDEAANPGVPYGNVLRKEFHADRINGHKMVDADFRGSGCKEST
jgi:hypothetical protein